MLAALTIRFVRGRPDRAAAFRAWRAAPKSKPALAETLPLLPEERSWSFRDMLAVKGGLAIATWGFLAGGATGQLVGFADGIAALFFGTALGIGLLTFALLLPVYRTGSESFVFLRSAFGPRGTSLLAVVLVLGIVPFNSAILSNMAGDATREVLIGLDFLAPAPVWPVGQATALGVLALSLPFGSAGKRYVCGASISWLFPCWCCSRAGC